MLSHTSFIWWMRLESNQQCREAGDLQSPGVTSFPTHPYFGSPSTDRTYDIFVNSEAQLPLCYRGIDWLQRQDSHLRSPAYETGEDDWTPLLCDNWCPGRDSNSQLTASKTAVSTNFTTGAKNLHLTNFSVCYIVTSLLDAVNLYLAPPTILIITENYLSVNICFPE